MAGCLIRLGRAHALQRCAALGPQGVCVAAAAAWHASVKGRSTSSQGLPTKAYIGRRCGDAGLLVQVQVKPKGHRIQVACLHYLRGQDNRQLLLGVMLAHEPGSEHPDWATHTSSTYSGVTGHARLRSISWVDC